MKTKKMTKKLQFKKQSIAALNFEEARIVKGGASELECSEVTGITCEICNSVVSCLVHACDWCGSR